MNKDKFFAREQNLDVLNKRVQGLLEGYRQNIAIIGDEAVGKTSIIFKFLERFSHNYLLFVYLETRHETLAVFVKRYIGVFLYNFLSNSGIPLKEDLDFLILKSQNYIPRTVEKIKILLAAVKRRRTDVFADLLTINDILYQETGKSVVVILDEFQNLESLGFKGLYREWSKVLISQKNTMYIIISSTKYRAKSILSKNLALLFGNFEVMTIEPFDIQTAERYLEYRLKEQGLPGALRDFIVHFTGGHPLYLELVSEAMKNSIEPDAANILERLLFDSSGALNQRYSNYLKRFLDSPNSNDYLSILHLVANGRNKIKDIAHIMRLTKKELNLRIGRLLELDTVTRSADFLTINDRVFGFWLKFVYQSKLNSFTFDAKNQKALFCEKIEEMIQDFFRQSRKPIAERMFELLRLFEDELIQVERRKIRLNHFREIKPLEFHNRNLKSGLLGRSTESLWIMAIKPEAITEEDIADFSRECKKYRHKLQRKVIVTLKDIDANTRLRAMEEKIWTWDINNINHMLDLYCKPWVVA